MSLVLSQAKPVVSAKSKIIPGQHPEYLLSLFDDTRREYISHIPMTEIMYLVAYIFETVDTFEGDPRAALLEHLKGMELVDGWNDNGKRFQSTVPLVLEEKAPA